MNREPTVLDYVKSLFRGKPLAIPPAETIPSPPQPSVEPTFVEPAASSEPPAPISLQVPRAETISLPWRSLLAL